MRTLKRDFTELSPIGAGFGYVDEAVGNKVTRGDVLNGFFATVRKWTDECIELRRGPGYRVNQHITGLKYGPFSRI